MEAGGDVNQADAQGMTPLHWAAERGHLACVQYLLTQPRLPGAASILGVLNQDGLSPVALAARVGHLDVVRALVEAGGDVAQANPVGWTPLHWAARHGHMACVQYLLSLPRVTVVPGVMSHVDVTAVALAAREGHVNVVKVLVEAGGDAAQADAYGWTPLHRAAFCGRLACVQYLLSLPGVELGALTHEGATAVALAAREGLVDVVRALVEAGSDAAAAAAAHMAAQSDARGWTPLHHAAFGGHLACVQYLLSVPGVAAELDGIAAAPGALTNEGATAVVLAAREAHVDVVRALVGAGGDAAQADAEGWTPLHWAARRGHLACVQYLLSVPGVAAELGALTHEGATAVAFAAREGFMDVVRALVEAGSDAAQPDAQGMTPLHWAAQRGHLLCAEYLLTLPSVDVSARTGDGPTAETLALVEGYHAIARVIAEEEVCACADLSAPSRLVSVVAYYIARACYPHCGVYPPWCGVQRDGWAWCRFPLVMAPSIAMTCSMIGSCLASPLRMVSRQARRRGRWTALRSAWVGVILIAHLSSAAARYAEDGAVGDGAGEGKHARGRG